MAKPLCPFCGSGRVGKFILRVRSSRNGDVEYESGLYATTEEDALREALAKLNAEVVEVDEK